MGAQSERYLLTSVLIIVVWGCEATPHCLDDDFDSLVRQFLANEQLTKAEIANLSTVFQDLQNTLQSRWPGSQVFALGSFVTGLASKSSDADCMVTVPLHDLTHDRLLILEAAHLLRQQPQLYDHIRAKVHKDRRMPLLKFTYVPTQRNCDVNFINNIPRENSRMMGYYFSLDAKFLSLAAILKLWSKVHRLKSTKTVSSNTLNLLIIFYLQQKNIAPPFIALQRHLVRCPANIWETSFKRIPYKSMNTLSLYQLLGGFFKYYSEFNFDEYVVSPLVGRPIHKRLFNDIDSLPDELYLYKSYMSLPNIKAMDFRRKMCVQDVIEQRRNTANVADNKADHFISHVKFAAKVFDVLPKDLFLRVILAKYTPHRHQLNKVPIEI